MSELAVVIMAAGVGKRMKSELVKVLHPLCGRPLVGYVVESATALRPVRILVVVGRQSERVRAALSGRGLEFVNQDEPRGTADAVLRTKEFLSELKGDVIVLSGDVPLLRAETLQHLLDHHIQTDAAATVLTTMRANPHGYGRIIRKENRLAAIVEERDADTETKKIQEVNAGIYVFKADHMFRALADVRPDNDQEEFYLTDAIKILTHQGVRVEAVITEDSLEVMGINDRRELAKAAHILRQRLLNTLMLNGVTITDPGTTYVDCDVTIGPDSTVFPFSVITKGSALGERCSIGPHAVIENSRIGADAVICSFVALRNWEVPPGERIEPFQDLSR